MQFLSEGPGGCGLCDGGGSHLCPAGMVCMYVRMYVYVCTIVCFVYSMDGFRVVRLEDVLPLLDILITATGKEERCEARGVVWCLGL